MNDRFAVGSENRAQRRKTHRMKNAIRSIVMTAVGCLIFLPLASSADHHAGITEVPMVIGVETGELDLDFNDEGLALSLEDAISISLERNLGLVIQRTIHTRRLLGLAETFGIYDLNLSATLSTDEATSPVTNALIDTGGQARVNETTFVRGQLSRLFPVGGTASIQFQSNRLETNDAQNLVNPNFSQGMTVSYNQPLLRNFGRTATERDIIIQRLASTIDQEDFDTQVEQLVQDIADAFWQLVEAREQLEVAEEALALAEELHKNNGIQVRVGTLAPLETVRSEAGVADRKVDIITRTAEVEDLQDTLRRLMNFEQGDLWTVPILPTIEEEDAFAEVDLETAIKKTLEQRNDLRRKRFEIEQARVDAKVAQNALKPQLDLDAGYTNAGQTGAFSDALNQVLSRDFDGWNVQLTFGVPLRNRAARARRANSALAVDQFQAELADLEQAAITTVRQQARAVESAVRQIEAATISAELEQKNLDAERKRYENGLSASFEILQIQEDLAQARSREVSAVSNYRRALVSLYRTTGELLDTHHVKLVDAVDPTSAGYDDIADMTDADRLGGRQTAMTDDEDGEAEE